MKPTWKIIIIAALILTSAHLVIWYVLYEWVLDIPEFIPATSIKTNVPFIFTAMLTVFIISERKILQLWPDISILKLTTLTFIIGSIAELIFQIVRCYVDGFSLYDLFEANMLMAAYHWVIAFLVAYQLKTKKTGILILFIVIVVVIANGIRYLSVC